MRFFYFFIFFIFLSCAQGRSVGPNYNQGRTHNQSNANRHGIVNKETTRVINSMVKARKKSSKSVKKRKKHLRKSRRFI